MVQGMTLRRAATCGALVATCALAACGGGSNSSSTSSASTSGEPRLSGPFADKTASFCTQAATRVLTATRPIPRTGQQAAAESEQLARITDELVHNLRSLAPPATSRSAYEQGIAGQEQYAMLARQARQAALRGDKRAYDDAIKQAAQVDRRAERAFARAGLAVCGGVLPHRDVAAITKIITDGQTHPSANDCAQHTSARFLELAYHGSVAVCAREVVKTRSATVHVSQVHGVAPLATATEAQSGGTAPNRTFVFDLIKQNGVWQVDDVSAK